MSALNILLQGRIKEYIYIIKQNKSFLSSHDGDDKKRPVIIHRAILGSVERMIAILTENYGGKW